MIAITRKSVLASDGFLKKGRPLWVPWVAEPTMWWLSVFFSLTSFFSCNSDAGIIYENGALNPEDGLASYEITEGFQVELFASEPAISDPVDMEIDEFGNLYVVEMSGYPLDSNYTGKIKHLRDTNGDGTMDASTLFADRLKFPNGILRWKRGFLVTDAPNVLYLEDSDGDGKADIRDTILSGFSLSNPHVNVNNPIYGLDNWIYLSHFGRIGTRKYGVEFGDKGKEIRFYGRGDSPVLPQNANSKNVRFRYDENQLEMRSNKSQFGHAFDDYGHHLLTHNQNHIYHEVLHPEYLDRKPEYAISNTSQSISDHENSTEVYQITSNPDRQLFTPTGVSTSSSGLVYYSGGLFQPPYRDALTFVAESVSNLVHVDFLQEKGASFVASRAERDKEFFASRDFWARPVNMYVGPDGALYVLDYYRRIIEHPEWMSDEAVEAGGLYDGHDMGRIYRITPVGTPKADWTKGLDFGHLTSVDLLDFLGHKNQWWRINAQRMLVERKDLSILHELKKIALTSENALARLHARWTLQGLGLLDAEVISSALEDPVEGNRENAIKMAELQLEKHPSFIQHLFALRRDPSAKVRFQLLCTLGFVNSKEARSVCEEILFRDMEDEWVQIAALTARSIDPYSLLEKVKSQKGNLNNSLPFIQRLAEVISAGRNEGEILSVLDQALKAIRSNSDLEVAQAMLHGFSQGLRSNDARHEIVRSREDALMTVFFQHPSHVMKNYALEVLSHADGNRAQGMERAMTLAKDVRLPAEERSLMLGFLRLGDPSRYAQELLALIQPAVDPMVQVAALHVFDRIEGTEICAFVLQQWELMTPTIREAAIKTFMASKARVQMLLQALEEGKISKSSLGWQRSVQLNSHSDEGIRNRARAILGRDAGGDIVERLGVLDLSHGDIGKGKEIFELKCAICHQVRGKNGVAYGPDLGTVHNWMPSDLFANIVDPGRAIAPGFDLWEVELKDGTKSIGMIKSESSNAIEFVAGPESVTTFNRQDILHLKAVSNVSPMPAFGDQLEVSEIADVISFLRNSESR